MSILTAQQITQLRRRLHDSHFSAAVATLNASAQRLSTPGLRVPPGGIAGWNHDYYCPIHHAPLQFDLARPHEHVCSFGGEGLTGSLYDACWWRKVNLVLAQGAQAAAILCVGGETHYLDAARNVLLEYAAVYPGYAVHGEIPHNGPGKANCQTLDEAGWIITLATTYDLISDRLSHDDRKFIGTNLLQECAQFLLDHREEQLHNHQCWIAAAIGVLGIVLDSSYLIHVALYDQWGLLEQLNRGVLAEGLWCEMTPTYHYYAFDAICAFARFHTDAACLVREHPALRKMPLAGLHLLLPDNSFPLLNDTTPPLNIRDSVTSGYGLEQAAPRLEIAAGWWSDPAYTWALSEYYQDHPRASLEALLYGPDEIRSAPRPSFLDEDYQTKAGGIVLLRPKGSPIGYVMLKNGPDSGEHDHRDRPGLSIGLANDMRFAPDLGTVPYGLPLHYGWFKTTAAHNTVVLNGKNQPPADLYRTYARASGDYRLVALRVGWGEIESPYRNTLYKRRVIVRKNTLSDYFTVNAPQPLTMDYCFHLTTPPDAELFDDLVETDVVVYPGMEQVYKIPIEWERLEWCDAFSISFSGVQIERHYVARASDNPFASRQPLWVLISRVVAQNYTFVHQLSFE